MRTMAAGKAKAHFLGLLDEVKMKWESITVTKHGKPIAKLVPLDLEDDDDPLAVFHYPGIQIVGDIESPIYTDAENEEFFARTVAQLNDRS